MRAPSSRSSSRPVRTSTLARHEPRAAAHPGRGRVRRAAAGRATEASRSSARASQLEPSEDDRRALPAPGRPAAGRRAGGRPHEARSRPTQILERLSQRLDLLKGGRDADPRQQTLRATIEWSYELLSTRGAAALRPPVRLRRRLHARGRRGGLPTPTSTRCSRSSRRASSASRTAATGCWRRSASTRRSGSTGSARSTLMRGATRTSCSTRAGIRRQAAGDRRRVLDRLLSEQDNFRAALAWLGHVASTRDDQLDLVGGHGRSGVIRGRVARAMRWVEAALRARLRRARLVPRCLQRAPGLPTGCGDLDALEATRTRASCS